MLEEQAPSNTIINPLMWRINVPVLLQGWQTSTYTLLPSTGHSQHLTHNHLQPAAKPGVAFLGFPQTSSLKKQKPSNHRTVLNSNVTKKNSQLYCSTLCSRGSLLRRPNMISQNWCVCGAGLGQKNRPRRTIKKPVWASHTQELLTVMGSRPRDALSMNRNDQQSGGKWLLYVCLAAL